MSASHPTVWQEVNSTYNTWTHPPWQRTQLLGEGHLCCFSQYLLPIRSLPSPTGLDCNLVRPSDMFSGTFWDKWP